MVTVEEVQLSCQRRILDLTPKMNTEEQVRFSKDEDDDREGGRWNEVLGKGIA